jgi:Domain of unknown function DUF302
MRRVAAEAIANSWIGLVQRLPSARQYEIGTSLTASKMTRHQLAAALYAPLRVVLFEDANGRGIFEYDKPSSLFGQFGYERVTEVGLDLDPTLEAALLLAAN